MPTRDDAGGGGPRGEEAAIMSRTGGSSASERRWCRRCGAELGWRSQSHCRHHGGGL